jgi:hypothetical protein
MISAASGPSSENYYTPRQEEMLDHEKLGNVLAAVGNHEGKAIVLLGMEPGESYGVTAMHKLYTTPQGEGPVKGAVNNQIGYCTESFEPIGAVAKVTNAESLKYEITDEGERSGKGVAGYALDFSLAHPNVSLRTVFGMTKSKDPSRRSPMRRVDIMRAILADKEQGLQTRQRTIAEQTDQVQKTLAGHLEQMAANGLIDYHSTQPGNYDAQYTAPSAGSIVKYETLYGQKGLVDATVSIINEFMSAGEGITQARVEYRLRQNPRYADHRYLAGNLSAVMRDLEKQGLLTEQTGYRTHTLSRIELSDEQQDTIQDIVGFVDFLSSCNDGMLHAGKTLGESIIRDPGKVRELVRKSRQNSPEVNGIPQEQRFGLITQSLLQMAGATTAELAEVLHDRGVTKSSLNSTLQQMYKLNLIERVMVGRENIWGVPRQ